MSHTVTAISNMNVAELVTFTVVNYTSGTGEAFTLAELGLTTETQITPVINPSNNNSLGSMIFPILIGGAVRLFRFVSGAPVEVPTTTGLNAVFTAVVLVTGQQLGAF